MTGTSQGQRRQNHDNSKKSTMKSTLLSRVLFLSIATVILIQIIPTFFDILHPSTLATLRSTTIYDYVQPSIQQKPFTSSAAASLSTTDSPIYLWTKYSDSILKASQHPDLDPNYKLQNITHDILHTITPRLNLAIRSIPIYNHQQYQTLYHNIQARKQYVKQLKSLHNNGSSYLESNITYIPPIQILVLGGSVAFGLGCFTHIKDYAFNKCSWPERLALLLNYDYETNLRYQNEYQIFDIVNFAVGGWNTEISTMVLQYDLLPNHLTNPDIIINAHSTNEMHVNTIQMANDRNVSHSDYVYDMTQNFIRTVLQHQCIRRQQSNKNEQQQPQVNESPILIYFDDYLGNDQFKLLDQTIATQLTHVLVKHYGVGYVSYADVVRDIVLRQTNETIFSPEGWYSIKHYNGTKMIREVHPGMGMHIASSFVLAYYLLTLGSMYVGMNEYYDIHHHHEQRNDPNHHHRLHPSATTTTQYHDDTSLLPPKLDSTLSLEDVTDKYWSNERHEEDRRVCETTNRQCPVSWLNGVSIGSQSTNTTMEYFRPYLVLPESSHDNNNNDTDPFTSLEWEWFNLGGRRRPRYGFVPKPGITDNRIQGMVGPGTNKTVTFHFDFQNQNQFIKTVTIFYLKKKESKWKGSKVTVSIYPSLISGSDDTSSSPSSTTSTSTLLQQVTLTNYYDSEIKNEMYEETVHLSRPQQSFNVELKHTGGETFRMTGIAVCE